MEDAYGPDSFAGYDGLVNRGRFAFPVDEELLDDRLRNGDMVLAIQAGGSEKAYALTDRDDQVINDSVGGSEVVVIVRRKGPSGFGFLRSVDGQTLTFTMADGVVRDEETGSRWDDGGRGISGPMTGARLTPVPSRSSFWFALAVAAPGIELHQP